MSAIATGLRPPTGILLPESVMQTDLFAILMMFVAINTLIYVCLAVAKIFPKVYLSDWMRRRGRRSETRSINPDASV